MFHRTLAVFALLFSVAGSAHAVEFTIELKVQAGKDAKSADAKYPAAMKETPRPLLMAGLNTPITLKWTVRNTDKMEAKDVLVHLFIVKIEKPDRRGAEADQERGRRKRPDDGLQGE